MILQTLQAIEAFESRGDHFRFAPPLDFAKVDIGALMDAFQRLDDDTVVMRRGAPLRVLCDVRASVNPARADRRPMYARHHEFDDRRIAVLGNSRIQQILFDFIVAATSHKGQARYFVDEAAAVGWLRSDDGR